MKHGKKKDIGNALNGLIVIIGLLAIVLFSSLLIIVTAPDPDPQSERGTIANIIFPGGAGSMAGA